MISFEEARARILEYAHPIGTEEVSLDELLGRVFANSVHCPTDVPGFDNSAVDGYALRFEDALHPRFLVGEIGAGDRPGACPIGALEAARIYTGAPIPAGADCVVMQEDVEVTGETLRLSSAPVAGIHIRKRGEEIAAGTEFSLQGRRATPPLVGLIASFGYDTASVFRRPRVAIVATGNELTKPGDPLPPGAVYASNGFALAAALRDMGGIESALSTVGDDLSSTGAKLSEALDSADVLITTGGVSVGDRDFVRPALASLGMEEVFWRVALKPGKPFLFGKRGSCLVFGLPGNPVSALVTFALLVRPALRAMLGMPPEAEEFSARLSAPARSAEGRTEFLRACLSNRDGVLWITPLRPQGSAMLSGIADADALLRLPPGAELAEGDVVTAMPLHWPIFT